MEPLYYTPGLASENPGQSLGKGSILEKIIEEPLGSFLAFPGLICSKSYEYHVSFNTQNPCLLHFTVELKWSVQEIYLPRKWAG